MKIEIVNYWTQVEGEEEKIRTFALIPDGCENNLSELPIDDQVFYWLNHEEWITLGAGKVYGDAKIIREEKDND